MKVKIFFLAVIFLAVGNLSYSRQKGVDVKPLQNGPADDIIITVNGKPFTSLISKIRCLDIGKPVFWPIYSAKGTMVNRGWPLVTDIPDEQAEHPHHTGLFFVNGVVNAGDVKDLNFWWARWRGERIRPIEITDFKSGEEYGLLETVSLWESPETGSILEQTQKNIFRYDDNSRIIDFDITLKALKVPVTFPDNKHGTIIIRVHRDMTTKFGSGQYIYPEGLITEPNSFDKSSKWVALQSKIGNEHIVIAIMFRPDSHNSPPYWLTRDYGCFGANPLAGRSAYSGGKLPPLSTTINPNESIKLKFRFLVYSGKLTKEELEHQYNLYTASLFFGVDE